MKTIANLKAKMNSDKAAAISVETIIIIALAVFAGLALFTFILKPVQNSADNLGTGIDTFTGDLMESQGDPTGIKFGGDGASPTTPTQPDGQ